MSFNIQEFSNELSRTREFPDVPFDNASINENRIEDLCPSNVHHEEINNSDFNDEDIHRTRDDPDVTFDSESNKDKGEIDVLENTTYIQDAFIFCPSVGSFALNETLKQGIFASEREMNQMEETKVSIFNRFITIEFETKDARSKIQAITDYLEDVKNNAKEYNSALFMTGIFSFEDKAPIECWLLNSIENAIQLPTNWMDISHLCNAENWPLLFLLSTERIEKERLNIPEEAFRFWEQQDFKELLNEVMDKSAFFKFSPDEEKMQGISYLLLKMFKIRRHISMLNMQPEIAS